MLRPYCHAVSCPIRPRGKGQEFCPTHWSLIPSEIQGDMARWWTPGEKAPKYRWARSKAVSFLGFVEGLLSRDEAEALVKRSRVRK